MSRRKIHIIGGPGSGKSYIAKILSEQYSLPILDLDDIFWNNRSDTYGVKADADERDQALNAFLEQEGWIVEGVYYHWLARSFKEADLIIALTPSVLIRDWRILKRFLKRRLGVIPSKKKETFKGLRELITWNHRYDGNNLAQARKFVTDLGCETVDCKDVETVMKFLEG